MMQETLARLGRMQQITALRHRDFRLLWIATLFSATARWADLVVVGWLTLELTESAFMVGVVAASRMAGYFAAPFMGVAADRMDRRYLLIIASLVNSVVTLILLLLLLSGGLTLGYIIGLSLDIEQYDAAHARPGDGTTLRSGDQLAVWQFPGGGGSGALRCPVGTGSLRCKCHTHNAGDHPDGPQPA